MNRFVAEFIGSPKMNIMPAPNGDANLLVGTRPHDMNPVHKQANADDFAVTGTLRMIEPAGHVYFLDVEVGGVLVKATTSDLGTLEPGQEVILSAPQSRVYRFDAKSGAAL